MTLDQIIAECQASGIFARFRMPADRLPIVGQDGQPVGFYAPMQRRGRPCMGFVYIAKRYRRQGHAERAVRAFLAAHPDMLWWALSPESEALIHKLGFSRIPGDDPLYQWNQTPSTSSPQATDTAKS